MIACDSCRREAASSDPAIGEIKAKESLGVAEGLRGCDRVAQEFDDVEDLSFLGGLHSLHVTLKLLCAFLGTVALRLVGFAKEKLTLAVGCLVEINKSDQY